MAGYVNGSNLLLSVGGAALGHCTTHTLTFGSESKEHAVKPLASLSAQSGLWKEKTITGLSISISGEGFRYEGETENGIAKLMELWGAGEAVTVKAFERGSDTNPYLTGEFIITNVEETSPAQDDTTYTISLENAGEPSIYPGKETTSSSE